MITIPIWQAVFAVFLFSGAAYFAGITTIALAAMAGYDSDELRSEE